MQGFVMLAPSRGVRVFMLYLAFGLKLRLKRGLSFKRDGASAFRPWNFLTWCWSRAELGSGVRNICG